jgi:hypothetical protein
MTTAVWERFAAQRLKLHKGDLVAAWQDVLDTHTRLTALDSPAQALKSLNAALAGYRAAQQPRAERRQC